MRDYEKTIGGLIDGADVSIIGSVDGFCFFGGGRPGMPGG